MKTTYAVLILSILLFSSAIAFPKDHSAEYISGRLLSWQYGSDRESCQDSSGVISRKSDCYKRKFRLYRVQIGDRIYQVRAGTEIDIDDPLRKLNPEDEFKCRLDRKGEIWVPAPINKGAYKKPEHEAKYIVEGAEK